MMPLSVLVLAVWVQAAPPTSNQSAAYGLFLEPDEVFHYGISAISKFDIQYAKEKGLKIKLVPYVGKTNENTITSFVLPRFISSDKYLYNVDNEYNGVITEAAFADKQFFSGIRTRKRLGR